GVAARHARVAPGLRSSDHAIAPINASPPSSAAHSQPVLDAVAGVGATTEVADAGALAATSGASAALAAGKGASAARPGISASSVIAVDTSPAGARASSN